jgi:preflagellin peptidase FlaK
LEELLAASRVAVTLVFLTYASWSDYKTREVSNRVWAIYFPVALALSLSELLIYDISALPLFGLSVGLTIGFSFLLFYSGAFGGADSKALMCIAVALPFFPSLLLKPALTDGFSPLAQTVFPVTILSNSVLIAAGSAVYLLLSNIVHLSRERKPFFEGSLSGESIGKKMIVLLTGQKFSIATLKEKWHIYPMEDVNIEKGKENDPNRSLVVVPKDEGRDEIIQRLSEASENGKISSEVWATPGLPMLIFVTVGLILALSIGDIVWILVSHFLG